MFPRNAYLHYDTGYLNSMIAQMRIIVHSSRRIVLIGVKEGDIATYSLQCSRTFLGNSHSPQS
jgi:hypothetical protein